MEEAAEIKQPIKWLWEGLGEKVQGKKKTTGGQGSTIRGDVCSELILHL